MTLGAGRVLTWGFMLLTGMKKRIELRGLRRFQRLLTLLLLSGEAELCFIQQNSRWEFRWAALTPRGDEGAANVGEVGVLAAPTDDRLPRQAHLVDPAPDFSTGRAEKGLGSDGGLGVAPPRGAASSKELRAEEVGGRHWSEPDPADGSAGFALLVVGIEKGGVPVQMGARFRGGWLTG